MRTVRDYKESLLINERGTTVVLISNWHIK